MAGKHLAVAVVGWVLLIAGAYWLTDLTLFKGPQAPVSNAHSDPAAAVQRSPTTPEPMATAHQPDRDETTSSPFDPPQALYSLRGTRVPPGLRTDKDGNLIQDSLLKLYFDYFLAAQHEVSREQLNTLVINNIHQHLTGKAAEQAQAVWKTYNDYLDDYDQLLGDFHKPSAAMQLSQQDLQNIKNFFDRREQLQQNTLPELYDDWFANANQYDRDMLNRYRKGMNSQKQHTPEPHNIAAITNRSPQYEKDKATLLATEGLDRQDKLQQLESLRKAHFPDRKTYIRQALRDLSALPEQELQHQEIQ